MQSSADVYNYFDRVVVISLARRPDRLSRFFESLKTIEWPFRPPQVFEGVDGTRLPLPYDWPDGDGAWGCMQSHRQVLERTIMAEMKSVLVLEDDVVFRPSFAVDVARFLAEVPQDWEGLMFGGQGFDNRPIRPGLVRCYNCHRTHAYAVRGPYLRALYRYWVSTSGHCDHRMGEIQHNHPIYAPDPFLAGQCEGKSDISGNLNPAQFWTAPRPDAPVVLLEAPREILPELRLRGFHTGHTRESVTDLDVGLRDAFIHSGDSLVSALREWIEMIQWEAASMENATCTVWHRSATVELVRQASRSTVIHVKASTVEEAMSQMTAVPQLRTSPAPVVSKLAVLLKAPQSVVHQLRRRGFHTGYWRDPVSDIDNGLIQIFNEVDPARQEHGLRHWFTEVGHEAVAGNAILTIWHPRATAEILKGASKVDILEIEASDADQAMETFKKLIANRTNETQPQ